IEALVVCGVAFMLNAWFGWKMPSLVLALAFMIVGVYYWAKPLNFLVVGGVALADVVVSHAHLAGEIEKVFTLYLAFLKWILLFGVTFLLITGTISFKGNPGAILPALVALS